MNENNSSTAVPVWTKLASRESQRLVLSTSRSLFTGGRHGRGSSVSSRTANDQSKVNTSEIPRNKQTTKVSPDTTLVDGPSLSTGHLQLDSIDKMSIGETRILSSKNVIVPIQVQSPLSQLPSQTTVKTETVNSSLSLNSVNITPLRSDSVTHSKQPLHISQTHISEDAEKSLLFHDSVVNTRHDSTSDKPTSTLQLSEAHQSSSSGVLQKFLAVTAKMETSTMESTAAASHGQFSLSWLQSSAAEETMSWSSLTPTPSIRHESTQNISRPLGVLSQFTSQRIVKTEAEDSLFLNSQKFTTNIPLTGDTVVHSNHVSEDAHNTLIHPGDADTRDTGRYSTSYKPAVNFQSSEAHQLSVSAMLQQVPAVASKLQALSHESTGDTVRDQFSPSWLQTSAAQETKSQPSVVPTSNRGDALARNISRSQFMLQRILKTEDSLRPNSRNIATSIPDDNVLHSKQPLHDSQMPVSEDAQKTSVLPDVLLKLSTVAAEVHTFSHKSSEKVASDMFSSSLPRFTTAKGSTVESSIIPTSSIGKVAETLQDSEYC